jgi:predicted DNA-binding transcriptional regulator AlpA
MFGKTNIRSLRTFRIDTFFRIVPSLAGVFRHMQSDGSMSTPTPIVLSANQVARLLGLSISTLAKMRLSGAGPAYSKLGRRVVYRPEDVDAWIAANRFHSTSEYDEKRG